MDLGHSCGRGGGRIEGTEGDRDSTRESTNLDPWGLLGTESPTKVQAWAGPRHTHTHIYVTDVQLGLHAGPPQTGVRAVLDSVACL